MRAQRRKKMMARPTLPKVTTGITGLDQITEGGLPKGRSTLVAGASGTGKTQLAMQFLANRAALFDEPGLFVALEESPQDLTVNFASLDFDLKELVGQKKLAIEHVSMQHTPLAESGMYNLDGLFMRVENAINRIGAKHVVLDPVGMLFAQLSNVQLLRVELARLLRWLRSLEITTIITSEREGVTSLGGLESYACDCVILLGNRMNNNVSTRWLRVAKYRGSGHATDEFPFHIGERGLSVLPVTSLMPDYEATSDRITTGVARIDTLLDGGYYRWSSILISGDAGTGKTSLAAAFAEATCETGERCLYLAFEEATDQVIRNMRSIGLDLAPHVKSGLLDFRAMRPTLYGLETHLVVIERQVEEFQPSVVIIDPISNLGDIGVMQETKSMLSRLVDYLKRRKVTSLFTSLTSAETASMDLGVSSVMDVWITLRLIESNGEQNRLLSVAKARGIAHSNQVREFVLSSRGIQLRDVYVGMSGVLVGSARIAQEERDRVERTLRRREFEKRKRELKSKKRELQARMADLKAAIDEVQSELELQTTEELTKKKEMAEAKRAMTRARGADRATRR